MNIDISEQNQQHIRQKIKSGRYSSPDDVIARALQLLDEHDKELELELADMRAKVQKGVEQADAGQLIPASQVFDELRRRNATFNRQDQ